MDDAPLPSPDHSLAQRLLGTVGYRQRFVGYRLHRRLGAHPVDLYGVVDVLALLSLPLPQVHIARLAEWVDREVGDAALAECIAAISQGPGSLRDRHLLLAQAVEARLVQAAQAVEPAGV